MLALVKDSRNYYGELPETLKPKIKRPVRKRKFRNRVHEDKHVQLREVCPIDVSETRLCVLLWQSVVIQALYDLSNTTKTVEAKITRAEASSWFAINGQDNSDFEMVCDLAGLSRLKVLRKAKRVLKNGEKELEGFNFRTIRRDFSNRASTRRSK